MITERIRKDINDEILPEFSGNLKNWEGKTILITGGNGFLASYLVDTLDFYNRQFAEKPIKMVIYNKNQINDKSRLSHLVGNENVRFVSADVGGDFEIEGNPDIIIHAASRANPKSFLSDPIDTINANVNGIKRLLDYAKENPVDQFIFFSSAEIYGNPVEGFLPTPEDYPGNVDCLSPHACYIEAKRFGETMGMAYYRQFSVPVKFLRILLAYGPGIRDDGKVISDFFRFAIEDGEIKIRDKGDAKRSFCYVSEAIRQIFKVIFYGKEGEAYNIGDDSNNVSIKELAEKISASVSGEAKVFPNESAEEKKIYGVNSRYPNIDKVKSLGFQNKVGLDEGLERLKEHYIEEGRIK